jgi:putative ABC transport system ATP-binding protein
MSIVRLEEIRKTYVMGPAEVKALDGVTVEFEKGSFWALMGPSGSGKSTLLNLLGCLDRPSSGRYLLDGTDVAELPDDALSDLRLRRIGFIFQSFNLIPELSVLENIELPLFYLGWSQDEGEGRARELAGEVGLGDRAGHRPPELSGGQQQRVAIARALANDPAILLADEPTGNLDTATGEQIIELLEQLNRRGKTIVMVTHEQEIAAHAGHRLHLRDGRIVEIER